MTPEAVAHLIRAEVAKAGRITAFVLSLHREAEISEEMFCLSIDQGLEEYRQKACESCRAAQAPEFPKFPQGKAGL